MLQREFSRRSGHFSRKDSLHLLGKNRELRHLHAAGSILYLDRKVVGKRDVLEKPLISGLGN